MIPKYRNRIIAIVLAVALMIGAISIDTSRLKGDLLGTVAEPVPIITLNPAFAGEEYATDAFQDQQYYELADIGIPDSQLRSESEDAIARLPDGLMIRHRRTVPIMGASRESGTFFFTLRVLDLDSRPRLDENGNYIYKHFKLISREANADFNQDEVIDQIDLLIYDTIIRTDEFRSRNPEYTISLKQKQELIGLYERSGKTPPAELY